MISNDKLTCPCCGGDLKLYDKVQRIVRTKGRETKHVKIRRLKCINCGAMHRELPDYILPYKQYEAEVIVGVLEGLITCETLGFEDYPCEMTMFRWLSHKSALLALCCCISTEVVFTESSSYPRIASERR